MHISDNSQTAATRSYQGLRERSTYSERRSDLYKSLETASAPESQSNLGDIYVATHPQAEPLVDRLRSYPQRLTENTVPSSTGKSYKSAREALPHLFLEPDAPGPSREEYEAAERPNSSFRMVDPYIIGPKPYFIFRTPMESEGSKPVEESALCSRQSEPNSRNPFIDFPDLPETEGFSERFGLIADNAKG